MPKLTINEISKIENLYSAPIVKSLEICSYCGKEITGYVFHTPGTNSPLCVDCFSEHWEDDSEDFETEPSEYEKFIEKYIEEEGKARKKLVDQILEQNNSFMYVEDLSSGQKGWMVDLREYYHSLYWLKSLYHVNVID